MSSMLREILRWREMGRRASPSERWGNWANSLAERHSHIFSRYHAPTRTLVLPMALLLRTERWQHHAWNLFPQIKLAISPMLRETVWKTSPLLLSGTAIKDFLRIDTLKDRLASAAQRDAATTGETYAHDYTAQEVAERERATEPLSLARPTMLDRKITIDRQKTGARESLIADEARAERTVANWPSPLSRIFKRIQVYETQMPSSRTLLAKESFQLVDRVAHKQVRIEHTVELTTVVQQRKKEVAVTDEIERPLPKSSMSRMGGAFDQSPVINIAELTEQVVRQIDSRIAAQKERLGRSF
jgi:hypothetical protein